MCYTITMKSYDYAYIHIHGGHAQSYNDYIAYLNQNPYEKSAPRQKIREWMYFSLPDNYDVHIPTMPLKEIAEYEVWKMYFEKILDSITAEKIILVGESLGAACILKYLTTEVYTHVFTQVHLIATPLGGWADQGLDDLNDFSVTQATIQNFSHQGMTIHLYHSSDDEIVPISHTRQLSELLPFAHVHYFIDRGHFYKETEFPELLREVLKGDEK